MLTDSVQKALNKQVVMEMYSANLYLSMAGYCEALSLVGCARWVSIPGVV